VSGIVHLVGAGPGDPELLTRKGARLLAEADAVVHDRLVDPALLELARPEALRVDAGKEGWAASAPQERTSELLVRLARAGLRVVRLKGGDPFVFGRGGEEALALQRAGVPFEIVPGVSAGIAGPAYAGIPVTHRGLARSVAFVTATSADDAPDATLGATDWSVLAGVDTLVVFMGGRSAANVARRLVRAGRPPSTPVAVVLAATRADQETRLMDLAVLAADGPGPLDGRPTLIVVGEVVALAPELAWFGALSLAPARTELGAVG